ncbi:MAG: hypothetical protein RLY31_825 [Bacteroidota bacterium]|jgi:ABC-type bacteriocin/lantibiotic exporter with double-glycine peptidase domain
MPTDMLDSFKRRITSLQGYLDAWRYLGKLTVGHRRILVFGILLLVLNEFLYLPNLWLIRHIVDRVIPENQLLQLSQIAAFLIMYNIGRVILPFRTKKMLYRVIHRMLANLRRALLSKILTFPHHYFMEKDRTILQTQIVLETDRLSNSMKVMTVQVLSNLASMLILLPFLVYASVPLFAVSVAFLPILYLANKRNTKALFKRHQSFRVAMEQYSKATTFVTSLVELIKFRSTEDQEKERYREVVERLRGQAMERDEQLLRTAFIQGMIQTPSSYLILMLGGWLVAIGSLSLGSLLTFFMASRLLQEKTKQLQAGLPAFIEGNEALQVLHAILSDDWKEPYQGTVRPRMDGEIRLAGVSFSYKDKQVLRNTDLTIGRQAFVAVLGANGSGKTTITRLVLGLYRPDAGGIFFDGIPADDLDFPYIRSQTGIVSQHPQLVEGSILDNIRYGFRDIGLAEVEQVCRRVLADDFIRALPEGYHTLIGENGATLSGGERQKIAFARALVGAPRLLILDEPTNHLDRTTVGAIVRNLRDLEPRPSLLLITHDPSIIDIVDRVYHLEQGVLTRSEPAADLSLPVENASGHP